MHLKIQPRFCLILIAVMLIVFGVSIGVASYDLHVGAQKLARVRAEQSALQQELNALHEKLAYTESDAYVERVARDELGLLKPGEIRYVSSK